MTADACACGCGLPVGKGRRRFHDDGCQRRARRTERVREPDEYLLALGRMIRSASFRPGFDADAFAQMVTLDGHVHGLLARAARELIAAGYSWGEIGRACGISRQAARAKWGR